jgi:hypothetical protein
MMKFIQFSVYSDIVRFPDGKSDCLYEAEYDYPKVLHFNEIVLQQIEK